MAEAAAKPGRKFTGKQAAIALGLAGVVILGYVLWRRRQAASSAADSSTQVPGGSVGAGGTFPFPIGSGSTGGGNGGGGGTTPPPPGQPPPSPPPQSCITIWFHGNPGHAGQYCGSTSSATWFQSGGQWWYFAPGGSPKYGYSAYVQGDPGMPPGAGDPPSNTAQAPPSGPDTQSTMNQLSTLMSEPVSMNAPNWTPDRQTAAGQLTPFDTARNWFGPPPLLSGSRWSTSPPLIYPVVGTNTGGVTTP